MSEKNRFLVCYDYGQGALWAYVVAESQQQVEKRFKGVRVLSATPAWLTPEEQAKLPVEDVAFPTGWLAKLVNE